MPAISLSPITGLGEIHTGDNLAQLFWEAFPQLEDGDIVVISSKAVSKAQGNVVHQSSISPSPFAEKLAALTNNSPAYCEVVLQESQHIVRMAPGVCICRTHHGFVMANAGVDMSNAGGDGFIITLPKDPDGSAKAVAEQLQAYSGKKIGVVISDTFGRAWRRGQTNMAIGIWGITPMQNLQDTTDDDGRSLHRTCIAIADELAAAADLVAGKCGRIPGVVIRGMSCAGQGTTADLIFPRSADLFL